MTQTSINSYTVEEAIIRAQKYTMEIQLSDGYWMGEFNSNNSVEAEHLFVLHILNLLEETTRRKIANRILELQAADGLWYAFYQASKPDLSITIENYLALRIAGYEHNSIELQRAVDYILANGGIESARNFTKIWLALFGILDWNEIPYLSPELILLPQKMPINMYEFCAAARPIIPSLTIIRTKKPMIQLDYSILLDLAFTRKTKNGINLNSIVNFTAFVYEKIPSNPIRSGAIKKCLEWIENHQDEDGTWAGLHMVTVFNLLALFLIYGLEHHPVQKGIHGLKTFVIEKKDSIHVQMTISPVWDTVLMLIGLDDSGFIAEHPMIQKAIQWVLNNQIETIGDWHVKNPIKLPLYGWAFQFHNQYYPDLDDTAEAIIVLGHYRSMDPLKINRAIKNASEWLLSMQSDNGGWGAFDKNNTNILLTKLPFFDYGEIIDPPSTDVTAHVLEALGRNGYDYNDERIRKGFDFLHSEQEENGSWFGRWGVNYIYGTSMVLMATTPYKRSLPIESIQKAVQWLISHQNGDGGWGESCESYFDPQYAGVGASTASQTAWSVLGLLAVGINNENVQKGIQYLIQTQNEEGTWDEKLFTGCGFQGIGHGGRPIDLSSYGKIEKCWMFHYELYKHYWPLMALGRYQKLIH